MRTAFDAGPLPRGAALRVTSPRVAVLTAVHEHPHTDTDTDSIIRIARGDLGEVAAQAVHDVPRVLTTAGPGEAHRTGGHHGPPRVIPDLPPD